MNDIVKLAVQVAPLLSGPYIWSVEPIGSPIFQHIVADGERKLVMHAHKDTLNVTGILPTNDARGACIAVGNHPELKLSRPGWEPADLARVLNKKLLPDYETALARAQALIVDANGTIAKSIETVRLIKQAVPTILGNRTGEDGENLSIWISNGKIWGDVHALGERVDLNVRGLPREIAIQVLEFVRGYAKNVGLIT
jgi:hypothetical protein